MVAAVTSKASRGASPDRERALNAVSMPRPLPLPVTDTRTLPEDELRYAPGNAAGPSGTELPPVAPFRDALSLLSDPHVAGLSRATLVHSSGDSAPSSVEINLRNRMPLLISGFMADMIPGAMPTSALDDGPQAGPSYAAMFETSDLSLPSSRAVAAIEDDISARHSSPMRSSTFESDATGELDTEPEVDVTERDLEAGPRMATPTTDTVSPA